MRGNVVALPGNGPGEDGGLLWRALADPTRRRILDLLRQRPLITGEIAARFPVSRIAVMRHLDVLARAGLVTSRKRGRERWHYLNAVPLQQLHRRWADPAAAGFASALLRLHDTVEAGGRPMEAIRPTVDVALDIDIAGPPAAVFAALTGDVGGWWGHPFVTARAQSLALDPRLGGLFTERWENGGQVIAAVTGWAQDEHLQLTGSFHMGPGIGVAAFDLAASGAGTLVRFSFRALGVVDAQVAGAMSAAWAELAARLKALVETRARLGIDPDEPPTIRSLRWRDKEIIPHYNAGGPAKFAFITGEGVPFPTVETGAEPAPDGPATFPTGWFASRDRAYQWLAE
jgi:DNA-binding transcriptional ArsR family regulator/uncharacterized protein YndB with AHSA1/START domain